MIFQRNNYAFSFVLFTDSKIMRNFAAYKPINSRISAITDELKRLCAVYEAQRGDCVEDVNRFEYGTLFLVMCLLTRKATSL